MPRHDPELPKSQRFPVALEKPGLHPRNRHRGRYDFALLIAACPALARFVVPNPHGDRSIDFANPHAVRALNRALLQQVYGVSGWDVPTDYLCPPIPGRADYLHGIADLLAADNAEAVDRIPRGAGLRGLDVGVGANGVYPLIGHSEYGWSFVGTDIDPVALASLQRILDANPRFKACIELRLQPAPENIFNGMLQGKEVFDFTLCNPPFHASLDEAQEGSARKWHNLRKASTGKPDAAPRRNFGGQGAELWYPGGEAAFVRQMIVESVAFPNVCLWFTTLVSKAASLPAVQVALRQAGVQEWKVLDMAQGQKKSRAVAWTFFDATQRRRWAGQRWRT